MSAQMDWNDDDLRRTAVHEAAHAVIAHLLDYNVIRVTTVPDERFGGFVRLHDHERITRTAPFAVFCLAGIVAEERVGGGDAFDIVCGCAVNDAGELVEPTSMDLRTWTPARDGDLSGAWEAVGRDWSALMSAVERTHVAVDAAWRRIDAVARRLERVRTIDSFELPRVLAGRGKVWTERALEAIYGEVAA